MGAFAFETSGASVTTTQRAKISASVVDVGVPMVVSAAGGAGLAQGTTTTWTDAVGLALDEATYSTTQGDVEGAVRVHISPTACYKWLVSGGATEGTAALVLTNSVASATGATVTITTGETAPTNFDEGLLYCTGGANKGLSRKITSVTATTAVVTVPFPTDLAVGDTFLMVPWTPFDVAGNNLQFSTLLTQADQSIAVGTGAAVRIVRLHFSPTDPRTDSYVYGTADDHVLNVTT